METKLTFLLGNLYIEKTFPIKLNRSNFQVFEWIYTTTSEPFITRLYPLLARNALLLCAGL